MRPGKFVLSAAMSAAALLGASPAMAHAKLVSSSPPANATVAPPQAISLTFSEALAPAFSTADLVMIGGKMDMKVPVRITISKDGKTLVATPQGKVVPGAYRINWAVTSADDGHKLTGKVAFKVS